MFCKYQSYRKILFSFLNVIIKWENENNIFQFYFNQSKTIWKSCHQSHMSLHLSFIWYSIYLMFLSHLDRMEISKRQREASLILPFVQQLSRREEESKFAFLKFEKSHASFQNVGGCTWEKKRNDEWMSSLYIYARFFSESDAIMNQLWHWLLMMIDKNVFFIYLSVCVHTSNPAVYCQLSSFYYDSVCCIYIWGSMRIHIDIKANKGEKKRKKEISMLILQPL